MGAGLLFVVMGILSELAVCIVLFAQGMLSGMLLDSSPSLFFFNMGLWSYYHFSE